MRGGSITFVGRADDMFVSGGENIYPGEVETILETHPAIFQACVIALPDEIKGTKPAAFVVLRPGARLSEDEARAYVLARAPAYAHPRRVWFLPELPLAGTNKIDRKCAAQRGRLPRLRRDTACVPSPFTAHGGAGGHGAGETDFPDPDGGGGGCDRAGAGEFAQLP